MKKIFAMVLSFALLLCVTPLGAIPVSAATSGTTGDCTWVLDGTHLTISGKGAMGNYSYQDVNGYNRTDAPWGWKITSVTIEDGVTTIGTYAFYDCNSLTSATIPDSVTSIGDYAFINCTVLTSITVATGNPNYCSVDGVLFNNDLTTLILYPEGKRGEYCIPDTVTNIDYMAFVGCNISVLTLPQSMSNVEGSSWGGNPFGGCNIGIVRVPQNTEYIDLEAFSPYPFFEVDPKNPYLCSIDGVLYTKDMTTLLMYPTAKEDASYTIPSGVTTIATYEEYVYFSAFGENSHLTSVILPESITSISGGTFSTCPNITSIVLPRSLSVVDIGAFAYCDSITDVYYSGNEMDRANIEIGEWGNDALLNATWHYNWGVAIPGDANGDGEVNNKDLGLLQQYLNEWDVTMNTDAADLNGDGKINNKDLGLLQRLLNQ